MFKDKKAIWGWAMYDWANSAFATAVMAGFFPIGQQLRVAPQHRDRFQIEYEGIALGYSVR